VSREPTLPLADVDDLRRQTRRTRRRQAVLAALALAALLAAVGAAPRPGEPQPVLPHSTTGIIVLDVSASISTDTYARIASTLGQLARSGGRYGLVLVSGGAYEALPPGTPARELLGFRRFFTSVRTSPGGAPELPETPWSSSFTGGTALSTGLELARDVLRSEGIRRGSILLVSDLADDPNDLPRLTTVLNELALAHVPVRAIGLNPSPEDARHFAAILGGPGTVRQGPEPQASPRELGGPPSPRWLVVAAAALLAALALQELAAAPLRLARPAGEA
jgi:hypothetical protein